MMNRDDIYKLIDVERGFQDFKWGPQDHTNELWLTILTEEVGELAQEVLRCHFGDKDTKELIKEAIQCAAVVVAWLENLSEKDEKPLDKSNEAY